MLLAKIAAETDVLSPCSVQRDVQETADIRHVYRFRATFVVASLVSHMCNVAIRPLVPGNKFWALKTPTDHKNERKENTTQFYAFTGMY